MLELDGSYGEGGGQILRTALVASIVTGTPVRIRRIRAARPRPALRPQHLAAVRAAAAVADAEVEGASPGSGELTFSPRRPVPGRHEIAVGTAGSACLVAQLVLVPLMGAASASTATIVGGTHNRGAPPAEFLQRCFLPLVTHIGGGCRLRLERHGFEPAGGGRVTLHVEPAARSDPLMLTDRAVSRSGTARAVVSGLPRAVAERELAVVTGALGWPGNRTVIDEVEADCPGNVLLLELERGPVTEIVSSVGRRGLPAEEVARRAVAGASQRIATMAPVGPHLADQLLVPLALGAGGAFSTVAPTRHFTTNAHTLARFFDTPVTWTRQPDGTVLVQVRGNPDAITRSAHRAQS